LRILASFRLRPGLIRRASSFSLHQGTDGKAVEAEMADLYSRRLANATARASSVSSTARRSAPTCKAWELRRSHVRPTCTARSKNRWWQRISAGSTWPYASKPDVNTRSLHHQSPRSGSTEGRDARALFNRELRFAIFQSQMDQGNEGARVRRRTYMEALAEHLTLWDATSPELVTEENWREVRDTYIDDKLKLGVREYLEKANPYARQAMLATLVENAGRGYWHPSAEELAALAQKLAESVVAHGPVCKAEIGGIVLWRRRWAKRSVDHLRSLRLRRTSARRWKRCVSQALPRRIFRSRPRR